jgi:hypothetical protein
MMGLMATKPKKRRPSSSHALSAIEQRAVNRTERNPYVRSLGDLLAELRRVAPSAFSETTPADDPQLCSDREQPIRQLQRRASAGRGTPFCPLGMCKNVQSRTR